MDEFLENLRRELLVDSNNTDLFFQYYLSLFRAGLYSFFKNYHPWIDTTVDLLARVCYERPYLSKDKGTRLSPIFYFYGMIKTPIRCGFCREDGPHLCRNRPHPYASGANLPTDPRNFGLEEGSSLRIWLPKISDRRMGQAYRYQIFRWYFRPRVDSLDSDDPFNHQNWVVNIPTRPDLSWDDALSSPYSILEKEWRSRQAREEHENCLTLYDNTEEVFPIKTEHQELEPLPEILIGPCPKFQILPPGGQLWIKELQQYVPTGKVATVWSDEIIPQVERVIDTTTACGHGHLEGAPLCPPVWSDTGKPAARHCEFCRRLVPLEGDTRFTAAKDAPGAQGIELSKRARRRQLQRSALNRLVTCEECQKKMHRQEFLAAEMKEDSYRGDSRYKIYYCPECQASSSEWDEDGDEVEEENLETEGSDVDEPCEDCGNPMKIAYQCPFCKTNCETLEMMTLHCTKIVPWNFARYQSDIDA